MSSSGSWPITSPICDGSTVTNRWSLITESFLSPVMLKSAFVALRIISVGSISLLSFVIYARITWLCFQKKEKWQEKDGVCFYQNSLQKEKEI